MSESDRGKRDTHLTAFWLTVVVLLVALIVGQMAYSTGVEDEHRNNSPAAYAQAAKHDAVQSCVNAQPTAVADCVYEKIESSQDQSRAEQDLKAQLGMKFWAAVMAVITIMTLLVTAAGVYFVKRTLEATLQAVEETGDATDAMVTQNHITEYSQRPWIDAEISDISMSSSRDMLQLSIQLLLRNHGKTPALNITSKSRIITDNGQKTRMGEFSPGHDKKRIAHNLLPGGTGYTSMHPTMEASQVFMVTIFINGQKIGEPNFVPTIEVQIEYEWGKPLTHGKTVKQFMVSAVDPARHSRDERLGIPITLGTVPVTQLKAIELKSPEIS